MSTIKYVFFAFILIGMSIVSSCSKDDDDSPNVNQRTYGIFKVLDDNTTVEMDGEVGSSSLTDFNSLEEAFPNINKINIKNCPGSSDDEVNLDLSLKVHQKGINIHLMDSGSVSSGGTDFFLAGIRRTRGNYTQFGVHAWAEGGGVTATSYPIGHANHLPYINYYVSVGFTQPLAEDFYYFTIYAAPANGMHWMTEAELTNYNFITP